MTESYEQLNRNSAPVAPTEISAPTTKSADVDWNAYIDTLISSPTTKIGSMPGIGATVTYSFMDSLPSDYSGRSDGNGFQVLNDTMKSATRSAFEAWANVSNISFVETTGDDALIRIGANSQAGSSGYAYLPSNQTGAGINSDIFLNGDAAYMLEPVAGTFGYETLLHEIGHALGLDHPHEGTVLSSSLDTNANTVMSYVTLSNNTTPQALDIAAITYLYGTSDGSAFSASNLQIGSSSADVLGGSSSTDYIHGQGGADYIALGGGDDGSYAGSGNDTVLGGSGADLVYGNLGLDLLSGGAGNDTLFGGQNEGTSAPFRSGADTLVGGDGLDVLYGNYGGDALLGGDSNDTLYGGQDDDTLSGGGGSDFLFGNLGNDLLAGGSGSDVFVMGSGQGADTISDFDTAADYVRINSGANGITSSADALALVSDVNGTAVLDLGGGNTVTFTGLSSSNMSVLDFWII
jgi:serralysin